MSKIINQTQPSLSRQEAIELGVLIDLVEDDDDAQEVVAALAFELPTALTYGAYCEMHCAAGESIPGNFISPRWHTLLTSLQSALNAKPHAKIVEFEGPFPITSRRIRLKCAREVDETGSPGLTIMALDEYPDR